MKGAGEWGTVEIRRPTPADVDRVFEIEQQSFARPWDREAFELLAACRGDYNWDVVTYYLRVAVEGAEVIGYVAWRVDRQSREGQVDNIAVSAEWRRKGIGTRLLRLALRLMKEDSAMSCVLQVRESNRAAQALYRKMGMTPVGRVPEYYGDEDALVYGIDLDSI